MNVYLIEKKKYRVYKSEKIVEAILGKTLTHTAKGAPEIDGGFISISDTKGFWGCAVSEDIPIGFDIEELTRTIKPVIVKKLHEDEQGVLSTFAPGGSDWREAFLGIWVQKEAYMKMEGLGLRMGLASFSVINDSDIESFKYQKLMIGVAGDLKCDIKWPKYDAPFEMSCIDAAAKMLSTKAMSATDLSKKLLGRGYDEETVEDVIAKMKDYGYLNDEEYARSLAKRLFDTGKAPRRIEFELIKKGVDKETAKNAASAYKEDSKEAALKIAEKYKLETEKDYAKLGRKLTSLGYEAGIIYDIINKLRRR